MADSIKEEKMTTKEAEQYLEDFKKKMKERFQKMKIRKNRINKIDERNRYGIAKEHDDNVQREGFAFADAGGENSNTLSVSTQNVVVAAGEAEGGETTFAISLSILKSKDDKRRCFIVKSIPCCRK